MLYVIICYLYTVIMPDIYIGQDIGFQTLRLTYVEIWSVGVKSQRINMPYMFHCVYFVSFV